MRTGQCAWRATWSATDPIISREKPPAPREPTTIMSASRLAVVDDLGPVVFPVSFVPSFQVHLRVDPATSV
jgi:hypothetical protein